MSSHTKRDGVRSSGSAVAVDVARMAINLGFIAVLVARFEDSTAAALIALYAVVSVLRPLSNLGFDLLYPREALLTADDRLGRSRTLPLIMIGSTIAVAVGFGAALILAGSLAKAFVLELLIAELLLASTLDSFTIGYRSLGRPRISAVCSVTGSTIRLIAVLALWDGAVGLTGYVHTLLAGYAFVALAVAVVGGVQFVFARDRLPGYLRDGRSIAIGQMAAGFLNDGDKIALARAGYDDQVGPYTLSYRFATLPLLVGQALAATTYRGLVEAYGKRESALVSHAFHLVPRFAAAIGVIVVVQVLAIDLVRLHLPDIEIDMSMFIVLSAVPVVRGMQFPLLNALTVAGENRARAVVMTSTALLSLVLLVVLVPPLGWPGAVATTYASDLAVLAWSAFLLRNMGSDVQQGAPA